MCLCEISPQVQRLLDPHFAYLLDDNSLATYQALWNGIVEAW